MIRIATIAAAAIALAIAACATQVPVQNYENVAVTTSTGKALSAQQVRQAIINAGTGLGWRFADAGSGRLEGTLNLRTHVAVIDVPYTATSYSIYLKRGDNLDVAEGKVHKNYNGWVQNLDKAIRAQINLI